MICLIILVPIVYNACSFHRTAANTRPKVATCTYVFGNSNGEIYYFALRHPDHLPWSPLPPTVGCGEFPTECTPTEERQRPSRHLQSTGHRPGCRPRPIIPVATIRFARNINPKSPFRPRPSSVSATVLAAVATAVSRRTDCHGSPPLSLPSSSPATFWSFSAATVRSQFGPIGVPIARAVPPPWLPSSTLPEGILVGPDWPPNQPRCHCHRRLPGPNSGGPRSPLPPPITLTPSPSSDLPIPTTGSPRDATVRRGLLELPSAADEPLSGSISPTSG